MADRQYFVLSIRHTTRSKPYIILWAENDAGYRGRIETAGRYTEQQVMARLHYYNNGWDTVAVPCDVAIALSYPVSPGFFDDANGRWLRNNRQTWQHLLKNTIVKPSHDPHPEFPAERRREPAKPSQRLPASLNSFAGRTEETL